MEKINITRFKELALELGCPKNNKERQRLKNLSSKTLKFLTCERRLPEGLSEKTIWKAWHIINQKLASWEKCDRRINHLMKTSKKRYIDYGHLAYNNSADDL